MAQAGATCRTGLAQPEAPPARTHEDCLGRCGLLSAARTGSRAAAAAPKPGPESRAAAGATNLKKNLARFQVNKSGSAGST